MVTTYKLQKLARSGTRVELDDCFQEVIKDPKDDIINVILNNVDSYAKTMGFDEKLKERFRKTWEDMLGNNTPVSSKEKIESLPPLPKSPEEKLATFIKEQSEVCVGLMDEKDTTVTAEEIFPAFAKNGEKAIAGVSSVRAALLDLESLDISTPAIEELKEIFVRKEAVTPEVKKGAEVSDQDMGAFLKFIEDSKVR